MKVYIKPVKMISVNDYDGTVIPIRFQIVNREQELITIKIGRIIEKKQEKIAGNRMLVFSCQSGIGEVERRFELKVEINTCVWYLYKI